MGSEQYTEYLRSEAWQKKRMQRLSISKFRCAACGSGTKLQVHHLTYARIFNEEMQDLLPLCELHHLAAEDLVDKGLIPRAGDVLFLATETIRLIVGRKIQSQRHEKPIYEHSELPKCELRNRFQKKLIEEDWFLQALKKTRPEFKRIVRNKFDGQPGRMRMMSNCFALFDRLGHRGRMDVAHLPKDRISRLICLNSATD